MDLLPLAFRSKERSGLTTLGFLQLGTKWTYYSWLFAVRNEVDLLPLAFHSKERSGLITLGFSQEVTQWNYM